MNLRRITEPALEPITVEGAMRHCRIDGFDAATPPDDQLVVEALIRQARDAAEQFTERCFADATFELRLDEFADCMALPLAPARSIDAVTYIDLDGALATLDPATYVLDDDPNEPRLRLAYGASWPATRAEANAVRIGFSAGYGLAESTPGSVPPAVAQAILLTVGHHFENREATIVGTSVAELPMGVSWLLCPYRRGLGV